MVNFFGVKMLKGKEFLLKMISVLFLIIVNSEFLFGSGSLKVGIYENDPKVFLDKNGNPSGIFINVLDEIAKVNSIEIEYIYGNWADHLENLENGRIDVLVDTAFSQKRSEKLKFNKIEVLRSWLQLYTLSSSRMDNVAELNGKKIGLLKGSVQEDFFKENFSGIPMKLVSFDSYSESIEALKLSQIDGIIVSRFFYFSKLKSREIVPAPVIFAPEGLYYSFSRQISDETIALFDKTISDMKNDPDSVFYKSLNRYLRASSEKDVPESLYWILLIVSVALFLSVMSVIFLRKQNEKKSHLLVKGRENLEKSELKYREIIELAADGILLGDKDGFITGANSSIEKIFEKPREDILRRHIAVIFEKESLGKNPMDFESLRKGLVVVNERNIKRPSGEMITVEMHSKMMPDGTYQSILRDITERKKLVENTIKMQKLESIGVLAGGIAHDFNNLLTGVFGFIELARMNCGNKEKCSEYTESAMKSLERAKALTYQLLTFSKGGTPVVKTEKIDDMLKDVPLFALSGSNCSAVFHFEKDLSSVRIDKNQISQVIENIVINARHAMPGGGEINISAQNCDINGSHQVLTAGRYVIIKIKDAGTGIDPKIISRIFDPFFTTKQTGSGLGLATAYSIIKKHQGFIDVESVPGKGSEFHIYLPSVPKESFETPNVSGTEYSFSGKGKVLVMDDEEIVRRIVKNMLERGGYEVVECEKGEEAISLFIEARARSEKFEFMIFDLTIKGGMGGVEAVKKIRDIDKKVPVLVASGYADDPAVSNPEKFGFSGSLSKPFKMAELFQVLKKISPE